MTDHRNRGADIERFASHEIFRLWISDNGDSVSYELHSDPRRSPSSSPNKGLGGGGTLPPGTGPLSTHIRYDESIEPDCVDLDAASLLRLLPPRLE